MNSRGFTYFVWLHPSNSSYTFDSYNDYAGEICYVSRGHDSRGVELKRRFKFTPHDRIISVPNSQVDVIDFLKNHPECEGSDNGYYKDDADGNKIQMGVQFKIMDESKDADIALEASDIKRRATNIVLDYKPDLDKSDEDAIRAIDELSILCGYVGDEPKLQLFHLLKYAENSPKAFLDKYEDPARRARYLVMKGLKSSNPFLKKKGFMIFWGNQHLGNNVDQAVQTIMNDKDLLTAFESEIGKV